jgi:hypothetical protein
MSCTIYTMSCKFLMQLENWVAKLVAKHLFFSHSGITSCITMKTSDKQNPSDVITCINMHNPTITFDMSIRYKHIHWMLCSLYQCLPK